MMAAAGESQCRYIYNKVYMQAFHAAKVRISEQSAKEKEKFRAIKRVLVAFL
jgi:predicted secreted acid phosphatase